jgi:AAA+ superfamily predicted ATPase
MVNEINEILTKTYNNLILRRKTVPLFMSDPGTGKSTIIRKFANDKNVNYLKITLSQRMPNEVSGGTSGNKVLFTTASM